MVTGWQSLYTTSASRRTRKDRHYVSLHCQRKRYGLTFGFTIMSQIIPNVLYWKNYHIIILLKDVKFFFYKVNVLFS